VRPEIITLQAQRYVSHHKPWHDGTFLLDLVLCLEMQSIAELDIVCERAHEIEHAKSLT
jgi:hypothetical protein